MIIVILNNNKPLFLWFLYPGSRLAEWHFVLNELNL
jgi:hypothetical protein